MEKSIVTRNMDQILIRNLITQLFIWNLDKISIFWELIIDNTPAPEIWRSLTCQNCQMICKQCCWDKQHANMSPRDRPIKSYALLQENDVSFFSVILTLTHRFYQHETIFVRYFLIVTNTFKIYFWDILELSENKHLFWDMSEMP